MCVSRDVSFISIYICMYFFTTTRIGCYVWWMAYRPNYLDVRVADVMHARLRSLDRSVCLSRKDIGITINQDFRARTHVQKILHACLSSVGAAALSCIAVYIELLRQQQNCGWHALCFLSCARGCVMYRPR